MEERTNQADASNDKKRRQQIMIMIERCFDDDDVKRVLERCYDDEMRNVGERLLLK